MPIRRKRKGKQAPTPIRAATPDRATVAAALATLNGASLVDAYRAGFAAGRRAQADAEARARGRQGKHASRFSFTKEAVDRLGDRDERVFLAAVEIVGDRERRRSPWSKLALAQTVRKEIGSYSEDIGYSEHIIRTDVLPRFWKRIMRAAKDRERMKALGER